MSGWGKAIIFSLLAQGALAAPSASTIKIPPAPAKIVSTLMKDQKDLRAKKHQLLLNVENSRYMSAGQTYFRDGASASISTIGFHLRDQRPLFLGLTSVVDLKDDYSAQENWNYFKPKEAYIAWQTGSVGKGAFGRKLETWSVWENYWGQALFQPRYSENRMHPELVGLTGWFAEFNMGRWLGTLAVLPVYIPEFGAHQSLQDHRFASKNPWFHPPPSCANFGTACGDIHYSTKVDAGEIVMNPGFALKFEQQFDVSTARLSLAYKPMPQLLLGFPSFNRYVLGNGSDYMDLRIEPRVIYQKLVSVDAETKVAGWSFTGTSIFESPDRDSAKSDWTSQKIQDAFILGVTAARPLGLDGPRATQILLGATRVWGGDAPDQGFFARRETLFERRYQYIEAYSVGLRKDLFVFPFPLENTGRVIYDTHQNGGVISLSSAANISAKMRAALTVDFIGLVNQHGSVRDGYLSTYRANDRVGVGMSYVY